MFKTCLIFMLATSGEWPDYRVEVVLRIPKIRSGKSSNVHEAEAAAASAGDLK